MGSVNTSSNTAMFSDGENRNRRLLVRRAMLIAGGSFLFGFLLSCGKPAHVQGSAPAGGAAVNPVGMAVPAMELEAFYKGKITTVRLGDYRGKWLVLFFYPSDFTFVCPTELVEMQEYYEKFRKAGAEVVSVSTDSAYAHRGWAEAHEGVRGIRFPMASDRAGKLSRAMGVYVEEKGFAVRASFVVNPEGVVMACEFHDEAIGRSAAELLRKLEAAVAVRESKGDFCPAAWAPGDEMVTPK